MQRSILESIGTTFVNFSPGLADLHYFQPPLALVCSSVVQWPSPCGVWWWQLLVAMRVSSRSADHPRPRRPPTHFRRHALVRSLARPFARRPPPPLARSRRPWRRSAVQPASCCLSSLPFRSLRLSSARLQFDLAACVRLRAVLPPHGYARQRLLGTHLLAHGAHRSLASLPSHTLAALPCPCSFVWFRVFSCVQLAWQVLGSESAACWCVIKIFPIRTPWRSPRQIFLRVSPVLGSG